jgi:catechol 2,3-dioxygenase-like lactoylglutathione lyase family enzyme
VPEPVTAAVPNLHRIGRLTRPVADLERAEQFYCGVLGFAVAARGPDLLLALGAQYLGLHPVTAATLGAPAAANDPGFQHIAIVVRDIDAAWRHVTASGHAVPISQGGPQHLPGGIAAWKFRDPDGHPLELLAFPPGQGRPQWHRAGAPLFQGIDHTAITIRNTDTSLRYYRDLLGLRVSSRDLNQGPTQQALDGIPAPVVRITQLRARQPDAPRLELLQYLAPPFTAVPDTDTALSHDQLTLHVRDIAAMRARLLTHHFLRHLAGVAADPRAPLTVRDPDGHALLIKAPPLPPPAAR